MTKARRTTRVLTVLLTLILAFTMLMPTTAEASSRMGKYRVTYVSAHSVGQTTIKVTWHKKAKADGYKIYRATSKNGKYKLVKTIKKGSRTYWYDTKQKTEKTYWYKVNAYDKYKKWGKKRIRYTKTSKKAHAYAKSKLRTYKLYADTEQTKAGKTKLEWERMKNVSGYKIYKASSKSGTYKLMKTIKSSKTTSYTFSGTSGNWYKVRAYKKYSGKTVYTKYSRAAKNLTVKIDTGEDEDEDSDVISESGKIIYPAVKNLHVVSTGGVNTVIWNGSQDEMITCDLQRADYNEESLEWKTVFTKKDIGEFSSDTNGRFVYDDSDVERGNTYVYRVRYNWNDKEFSEWESVTVTTAKVDIPDQITFSTTGTPGTMMGYKESTGGHIGWGKVEGATYELEMKIGKNGTWTGVDISGLYEDTSDSDRLRVDYPTETGTTYYFRVRAKIGDDYSDWSNGVAWYAEPLVETFEGSGVWTKSHWIGDDACEHDWEIVKEHNHVCYTCGLRFLKGQEALNAHKDIHTDDGDATQSGTMAYHCTKCGMWK